VIPAGRTAHYAVWRACERISVLPPDTKPAWDACNIITKAEIIAYDQIRQHEEHELLIAQLKARLPV
jgi:hypothetical protein